MKLNRLCKLGGLAALALGFAMGPKAEAAYVVTLQEVGNKLVATGSGSIDTTGLTSMFSSSGESMMGPSVASIVLGAGSDQYYSGITGPVSFGTGGSLAASSGSGNIVGLWGYNYDGALDLPLGYASGTSLGTSTAVFNNESFASMGITPGSYIWTWGTGDHADSFTLNIGGAVPEPASLTLLGVGIAGLLTQRRRKRR